MNLQLTSIAPGHMKTHPLPSLRQMEWKHERSTASLCRFANHNLKNLFKSQPTLIFAIDVCLRGVPSHLERAQIKHQGPKGWVRRSPPGCGDQGSQGE